MVPIKKDRESMARYTDNRWTSTEVIEEFIQSVLPSIIINFTYNKTTDHLAIRRSANKIFRSYIFRFYMDKLISFTTYFQCLWLRDYYLYPERQ